MREKLIERLTKFIGYSMGEGIPLAFDASEDEMIHDPQELQKFTDDELLDIYEATVGFQG